MSDTWHVMPTNDLRPHVSSPDCWCKPTPDEKEENMFIHHAMDERQKYETEERKPS
jgi:hypothetical protein